MRPELVFSAATLSNVSLATRCAQMVTSSVVCVSMLAMGILDEERYRRGIQLLEGVVAMLTKMSDV